MLGQQVGAYTSLEMRLCLHSGLPRQVAVHVHSSMPKQLNSSAGHFWELVPEPCLHVAHTCYRLQECKGWCVFAFCPGQQIELSLPVALATQATSCRSIQVGVQREGAVESWAWALSNGNGLS